MSLLDLLLRAQLPAWVAILLAVVGVLGMGLYGHILGRRLKVFEHRLQTQATRHEKQLEFVQERHKKRLDALDELNATLMEFDHAVMHVSRGDVDYINQIDIYSARARAFARQAESLLGESVYQAVLSWTDHGRAILKAHFCVTERTAAVMEACGLPAGDVQVLRSLIGTRHSVSGGGDLITKDYDPEARAEYHRRILGACELSAEFDEEGYHTAQRRFHRLKSQILRTLPAPQEDGAQGQIE